MALRLNPTCPEQAEFTARYSHSSGTPSWSKTSAIARPSSGRPNKKCCDDTQIGVSMEHELEFCRPSCANNDPAAVRISITLSVQTCRVPQCHLI